MPDPMSSTETGRIRRPGFEAQPPAVESPGRGRRVWTLVPVCAGFAVFGVIVWLAYQDAGLGRPSGEPPLIRAAPEPIKLPPEQAEEPALAAEQGGAVGRLWSDGEQAEQPERLLPPPEEPLSPPSGAPPAEVAQTSAPPAERPAGAPTAPGAAQEAAGAAAQPPPASAQASAAAPPPASDESLQQAEAALDRLLAEVTAMSEDKDAAGATAAKPSQGQSAAAPPEDQGGAAARSDTSPTGAPPTTGTAAATETPAPPPAPPQKPAPQPSTATATAGTEMRPAAARAGAPASNAPPPGSTETAALAPAPAPPPTAAEGEFRIQLAAVRGEADARRAWDLFAADLRSVLRGVQPIFERADTTNGVFYRVQIGPFASQDAAESLCEQLKQHNASCFVIRR